MREWDGKHDVPVSRVEGLLENGAGLGYNESEKSFRVPASIGSAGKKFYVKSDISVDNELYIKQGSEVTGVVVFERGKAIREVERLIDKFRLPNGNKTKAKDWEKVRGTATLTDGDIVIYKQEIHWYQCKNIGKIEFKIKQRGDKA